MSGPSGGPKAARPVVLAARMQRMAPSATAATFERVAQLRAQGVTVHALSLGEPDFEPPAHVRDAMKRAIDAGASRYTEVSGMRSLREAICEDSLRRRTHEHAPDEVVVSAGAKHALFNLAQALFDHGDEVVIPTPVWGSYAEQARLCGAAAVLVRAHEADGYRVTPRALASALTVRTKAVMLCAPSNPTGATYGAAELRELAAVLAGGNAYLIVDEIYSELLYDGRKHVSILEAAPELRDRLILVDGVSKRFAMTGYRVGWILAPRAIARACEAVQSQATTSVASPSQHAAEAALRGPDTEVRAMCATYQARRDLLLAGLARVPGIRAQKPDGAFYVFANVEQLMSQAGIESDLELADALLEHGRVAVVAGSAFHAPGHIRLSYATDTRQLERAIEALRAAAERLIELNAQRRPGQ